MSNSLLGNIGSKKKQLREKSRRFMTFKNASEKNIIEKRPNFLIIGAQKAGTTWLHRMLNQHPDIFFPEQKELHHFSNQDRAIFWGLKGYVEKYFASVKTEKCIGEATADYLWCSPAKSEWYRAFNQDRIHMPERIKDYLGEDLKLIVSLRNPVDRAISAYFHNLKRGRVDYDKPFFKMAKHYGIIHLGFYYEHLSSWLNVYPMENFKILIFEELMADQTSAIKDILRFLEVDPAFIPQDLNKVVYKGLSRKKIDNNYYIDQKSIKGQKSPEDKNQQDLLLIQDTDVKKLKKIFRPDVKKLSRLLNKDLLSTWEL